MKYRLFICVLLITLVGGSLLAACGDDSKDSNLPPNVVITIQPQPDATIVPGCQTGDLESWYEVAGSLITTFGRESLAALDLTAPQMASALNRLIDLRNAVAQQPTPECALTVQGEILLSMRRMLDTFEQYSREEISQDDLRQQIQAGSEEINTRIADLLAATQSDLEEQLRQERENLTPTP